jgi:hypothetical protein
MATCKYCQQSAGWISEVHEECKVEYYKTMSELMLEGKAHKAEEKGKKSNIKGNELSQGDLELLDSTFLKRGAESWIWMQQDVELHLAEVQTNITLKPELGFGSLFGKESGKMVEKVKFNKQKKGMFAISNRALHGVSNSGPTRWPLEAIGQISAFENKFSSIMSNSKLQLDFGTSDAVFEMRMSASMGDLPTRFMVVTSEDQQFRDSQVLLIKNLIELSEGYSQSRDSDSSPTPTPTSSGKSLAEQMQDLAQLKEQGILTDDEFTAAKQRLLQAE